MTTTNMRKSVSFSRTLGLSLAAVALAACSSDRLEITNPNTPTVVSASADPQALQLQATGLLRQLRNGRGAYIFDFGRFGRELYIYTPQEGRNTSHYLTGIVGANKLDPSGFAVGQWGGPNGNLRDIFIFDTDDVKKAQEWCDQDPAIQAGTLRVELHKWYAAKGITYDKSAEKK